MSDREIIALCEKVARDATVRTLQEFGFSANESLWVTKNYALSKILKAHRIGYKRLERAMYIDRIVEWKYEGRNIFIKRESLKKIINHEQDNS